MAIGNVMRCLNFDQSSAAIIVKRSTICLALLFVDVMRFPEIQKDIDRYVTLHGKENLVKACQSGNGAIMATAHSDNWELLGGALALNDFKIVGVAMKQKSQGADRFINEYRTDIGMHITYKDNVREMFNMLKQGWAVGLIMDQDTSKRDGIIVDFLGRPTCSVTGAATLARWGNSPIVPAFIHRRDDGTHEVTIHEPIIMTRTKDKREDIRQTTQDLAHIIEQHVRKYPEEWFWLHDRWKSIREEWHLE